MNKYFIVEVASSNVKWVGIHLLTSITDWLGRKPGEFAGVSEESIKVDICVKFNSSDAIYVYSSDMQQFSDLLNASSVGTQVGELKNASSLTATYKDGDPEAKAVEASTFRLHKSDLRTAMGGFIPMTASILFEKFKPKVEPIRLNIAMDPLYAF
jgi:hypothetical protein